VAATQIVRDRAEPRIVGGPLPGNLLPSVEQWLGAIFWTADPAARRRTFRTDLLNQLERQLGVVVPFDPASDRAAFDDLIDRVRRSEEFAVRALAILLARAPNHARFSELADIFESPGSRWEVFVHTVELSKSHRRTEARLALRQSGPVPEIVAGLAEFGTPAQRHLDQAMQKLSGPGDGDPVGAYSESIKAVEAAARPVVVPNDAVATLGTMISAMRDRESKWRVVLAGETTDDVVRRMEVLWKTPHERHGSDLPQPSVTIEQARAGFSLAVCLVDYFVRGSIFRVQSDEDP
jgi:hypothetical protein